MMLAVKPSAQIYVSRERGLVIVFAASMQNDVAKDNLERLVRDYMLPATE